ncbi:MAG: hypothetical protein U9N46_03720, partial [Euryarchaeota archaeon]|nr:hypothetical protein [Euryarchaeota archaeon]
RATYLLSIEDGVTKRNKNGKVLGCGTHPNMESFHHPRQRLKETGKFVRNQVNKPVQNPTMRWVFFLFRGITEATIRLGGASERGLANMAEALWNILTYRKV